VPNGSPVPAGTLTVDARDLVGHTSSKSAAAWPFTGFLSPVNNLPTVNVVKAGNGVPVKFSLGADRGLAFGTFGSQQVACESGAPVDDIELTVTAGSSSLTYDTTANQYTYVWKTDRSWSGQCRLLTLAFTNGDTRQAEFKFK
jgi:hypothetical protein